MLCSPTSLPAGVPVQLHVRSARAIVAFLQCGLTDWQECCRIRVPFS